MDGFHQTLVQVHLQVFPTTDNQDGWRNGHRLSVSAVVVTLTYLNIFLNII